MNTPPTPHTYQPLQSRIPFPLTVSCLGPLDELMGPWPRCRRASSTTLSAALFAGMKTQDPTVLGPSSYLLGLGTNVTSLTEQTAMFKYEYHVEKNSIVHILHCIAINIEKLNIFTAHKA